MKIGLNVLDRINILGVLPKEGNYADLKIIRETGEKVGLTEEDIKKFDVKNIPNKQDPKMIQTVWNDEGSKDIEFEFGDRATELIKEALKKLNDNKTLTAQYLSTYEKFNKED